MRKSLIAGNWKMNGLTEDSIKRVSDLLNKLKNEQTNAEILICPPFTLISKLADLLKGSSILLGAQDCHFNEKGAHTGDVSPTMLKDISVNYVILGHSERRADHNESNQIVSKKMENAINSSLKTILCVGETKEEKQENKTLKVVENQIINSLPKKFTSDNVVIAYEPVWAIGTGLVPTLDDIKQVHNFIRDLLVKISPEHGDKIRILYGGSLNPKNAKEILAIDNVDGGLIGGASLVSEDFFTIISSL